MWRREERKERRRVRSPKTLRQCHRFEEDGEEEEEEEEAVMETLGDVF